MAITPQTATADALTLWSSLPEFVQQSDAANNYVFLTWVSSFADQLQLIDTLARDQGPVPGWSIVLDVSRCPTHALPWLAQFVGTRLDPTLSDTQMRSQIFNPPGWGRGTSQAIVQVANLFLKAGYTAVVLERDPDPYSITVQMPAVGLNGYTYAEIQAAYPTYLLLDGAFPTYSAWTNNETGATAAILAAAPAGIVTVVNYI